MKKLIACILCSCFLITAVGFAAETKKVDFSTAKPRTITRNKKDPLKLNLMGQDYTLWKSEIDSDDSNMLTNEYFPSETDLSQFEEVEDWEDLEDLANLPDMPGVILIQKFVGSTGEEVLEAVDMDRFLTFDTRTPEDQIVSGEKIGDNSIYYCVMRVIQKDESTFMLTFIIKRNTQNNDQWSQLRKNIFASVKATPTNVITENFLESICKFGSDCRP